MCDQDTHKQQKLQKEQHLASLHSLVLSTAPYGATVFCLLVIEGAYTRESDRNLRNELEKCTRETNEKNARSMRIMRVTRKFHTERICIAWLLRTASIRSRNGSSQWYNFRSLIPCATMSKSNITIEMK
jgi:hypothetical protein